jgi:hypothetical protein
LNLRLFCAPDELKLKDGVVTLASTFSGHVTATQS